jgi:hypothetical protein
MAIRSEPLPNSTSSGIAWKLGLVIVLVVIAVAAFFLRAGQPEPTPTPAGDLAWYSADDGKTWFADKTNRLNMVMRDGRPAYRCWVYTCDGGKTKFAAYLQRFAPEVEKKLAAFASGQQPPDPAFIEQAISTGLEVKLPLKGTWINIADPRAATIQEPVCPGGAGERPQLVPVRG